MPIALAILLFFVLSPMVWLLHRTRLYADAVKGWSEEDRAFVPHAATWFNSERYADSVESWKRLPKRGGRPEPVDHSRGF